MKRVTISQAKSRLSAYIKSAQHGEEIVIMRGSKPAVILKPISEDDLELIPEIPLRAVKKFEREIEQDRKHGRLVRLGTPAEAVAYLRRIK